ncbi:hypothetical protein [Demequina gelatinilytica]|uniref:hypothetical protein n=1 Tax=Demequina gelatinilytica TaxID=1638980 RepID=UPI000785DCC5|nr:hypothetical protein [Demequina gelatinilytica]
MTGRYAGLDRRTFDRTLPAVVVIEHFPDGAPAHYVRVGNEITWVPSHAEALRRAYVHNVVNGHAATPADLRKPTPTTGGTR